MKNIANIRYLDCSDSALTIEFGNQIKPEINQYVLALAKCLEDKNPAYMIELIPTYRSLTIIYQPKLISVSALKSEIDALLKDLKCSVTANRRLVEIPVCYDEQFALDLEYLAKEHHLMINEVITLHSERIYLVYMLGFIAGFPYLGGMNKLLSTARKSEPRLKIAAGSVGIAGEQTGIYSLASPAGWQIIGRTPLQLFNPNSDTPFLLKAGDNIKFKPIDLDEYHRIDALQIKETKSEFKPAQASVEIIKTGVQLSIQDNGRRGYAAFGVSESGAIDKFSYQIANALLENDDNVAVLELLYGGAELIFKEDCQIALTGADCGASLNGKTLANWQSHTIKQGDNLKFGFAQSGLRAYIAVGGGVDCPLVLGSRATDVKTGIGGLNGENLKAGDLLAFKAKKRTINSRLPVEYIPKYSEKLEIRVIWGPQADYFPVETKEKFLSSTYTIMPESDRMGYRLKGEVLEPLAGADIISDAIVFGSIQVSNNGQPIVMMADHQTTGGYAKIATVITADLDKLAQARADSKVSFKVITIEEAQKLVIQKQQYLAQINDSLEQVVINNQLIKNYRVIVNDKVYELNVEEI